MTVARQGTTYCSVSFTDGSQIMGEKSVGFQQQKQILTSIRVACESFLVTTVKHGGLTAR
eukprot:scaffold203_cov84-Cylindrotheca_fusiformis.AAC.2